MGLLYDITKDYLYKEGVAKDKHEVVVNMLKEGTLPIEQIAKFTGVSLSKVKRIAEELKK
jgi:DNA invertase Pin-like site-specific DNA recombinase